MEKYGFVYIWRDRKHNRYYIGSHWGTEDDAYVCSSPWMSQAYKHRPNDFKRRILEKVYSNKKQLLESEFKWISLIKESEIPQYAGLMYSDGNSIRTVKEAKFIHKEKLNLEEKLCDKFYYYWKDEERTTAILEKIRDEYYEKTQNLQKIINESNKNLGNNTP